MAPKVTTSAVRHRLIGVLAVPTISLVWMLVGIERPAPWIDEAATMVAVQRSWTGVVALFGGADAPLVPYYILAKAWSMLWAALPLIVSLRLLSAVAAAATAGLLFWLVRGRTDDVTGAVAAAILIVLPSFVRYGQEARPYALLSLAVTVSWVLWSRIVWLPRRFARRPFGMQVALAASLTVGLLTSLFAVFQWPAQMLAALTVARRGRRGVGRLLWSFAAAGVLGGVPAWLAFRRGTGPQQVAATGPDAVLDTMVRAVSVDPGPPALAVMVVALAVAGGVLVARHGRSGERQLAAMAGWWAVVPTLLSLVVVLWHPGLLRPRYLQPALVPLAILAALAVAAIARQIGAERRWQRLILTACLVAPLAVAAAPVQHEIRAVGGHDGRIPPLLTTLDTVASAHPQARLLVSNRVAAVLITQRPQLAQRAAGVVVRDRSRQVWPRLLPDAQLVDTLTGDHELIWVAAADTIGPAGPRRPPWLLRGSGFVVSSVNRASTWFVVVLRR